MAEFEIPCESREKSQVLLRLNQWLLERYRAGETAVLIIDEAQNLTPEVLEEIRLLTNLETSTEKLLQIVLDGPAGTGTEAKNAGATATPPAHNACDVTRLLFLLRRLLVTLRNGCASQEQMASQFFQRKPSNRCTNIRRAFLA